MTEFEKNRKQIVEDMMDSLGYVYCQRCAISNGRFTCHHIIYRSELPKHPNLHKKPNLINLCDDCHQYFHKRKSNRNYLIIERKLWELFPNLQNL